MKALKLYEFPMSHYCEKVRWALDMKQAAYERKLLLPVFHMPVMLALTRQTQVPVLECDGERVVNSADILRWVEDNIPASPSLFPSDADQKASSDALCAMLDRDIGPHVRRVGYYHATGDMAFMRELLTLEQPLVNRTVLSASLPLIVNAMRKGMGIHQKGYERSLSILEKGLNDIDQRLSSCDYLVGDCFGVADITAASLLAPMVLPDNSFYALPTRVPDAYRQWVDSYRDRPFHAWVKRMYLNHR
jgi:glutathione S-transferase